MAVNKILDMNTAKEVIFTAVTSAGIELALDSNDAKTMLLVNGVGAGTVTIEAGDTVSSGGTKYEFTVANGKTYALAIDSARFVNLNTGKIKIKASAESIATAALVVKP